MKSRTHLLTFLEKGEAHSETMAGAPSGSGNMLRRSDGAKLLTTDIPSSRSEGLVAGATTVRITSAGRSWLRRHAARLSDTPFAEQHRKRRAVTIEEDGRRRAVSVNLDHSPLSRLAQTEGRDGRRWIDATGVEAGERLVRDFEIGGLRQRVTSSWDPTPRTGGNGAATADLGDAAIDARARLDRALSRLGPELAGVALDICCFAKGTSQVERERLWPPRSAKLMLRTALNLLAHHYGLHTGNASGAERKRSWSTG